MVCVVCGQESTEIESKKKTCTGVKRIRKCDEGHKFLTYQAKGEEEKLALVLASQESARKLRREMAFQAFLDCKFKGQVQPGTLALAERIRRSK